MNPGKEGWTEVISRKQRPHKKDPFAGMKSCVNYELEIERLKQLVKCNRSYVTEQEKFRFLAFVCSWTGKGDFDQEFLDNSSLWAIASPWHYCHSVQNKPLSHSPTTTINRHGPIGMGRRKH